MNPLIQLKKAAPVFLVALMLLAAFVPKANALIAYFDFEGPPTPPYPVNLTSSPLGFVTTMIPIYLTTDTSAVSPGLPLNALGGGPNNTAFGLKRTGANSPANFDIPLFTALGFPAITTVTFAYSNHNGFTIVSFYYSTNGGATFIPVASAAMVTPVQPAHPMLVTFAVPSGANNEPLLELRLVFTGGGNGTACRTRVDNIQIN